MYILLKYMFKYYELNQQFKYLKGESCISPSGILIYINE